jgi:hypothetical protein
MNLTIDEKMIVAPQAFMTFLSSFYILAFGGSVSPEAERQDVFNFLYPVSALTQAPRCADSFSMEVPPRSGSLLIRPDLKTKEGLNVVVTRAVISGYSDRDTKNGMQNRVVFAADTSGSPTPGATLAKVTLMSPGNFLIVDCKYTHILLVTIGPSDKTNGKVQKLQPTVQNMY